MNEQLTKNYITQADGIRQIITYVAPQLKNSEEQDYLIHFENEIEGSTQETFFENNTSLEQ